MSKLIVVLLDKFVNSESVSEIGSVIMLKVLNVNVYVSIIVEFL